VTADGPSREALERARSLRLWPDWYWPVIVRCYSSVGMNGLPAAAIERWDIGEWTRRALGAWRLEPFGICVQWQISLPARRALWHVCLRWTGHSPSRRLRCRKMPKCTSGYAERNSIKTKAA
jgi:hypothetical protein